LGIASGQLAQRVFIPIAVRICGRRNFASTEAYDGGLIVSSLLLMFFGTATADALQLNGGRWAAFYPFAITTMLVSVGGFVQLYNLGSDTRRMEWKVADGEIRSVPENQIITPTTLRKIEGPVGMGYHPKNYLELYDGDVYLGTNGYSSKGDWEAAEKSVKEVFPGIGWLVLSLVWKADADRWNFVEFPDCFVPILCGSLLRLPEGDRDWWRMWTRHNWSLSQEFVIDKAEWLDRVRRLKAAYPEFMPLKRRRKNLPTSRPLLVGIKIADWIYFRLGAGFAHAA